MIIRTPKHREFTTVHNSLLKDRRLSWKAKGLAVFMLSLPNDWEFHPKEIQRHSKGGRKAVYSGIRELIEAGYLVRERWRERDGTFAKFAYVFHEVPLVFSSVPLSPKWYVDEDKEYQALIELTSENDTDGDTVH